MSDTIHRRRSISRFMLMTLLFALLLPMSSTRQQAQAAPLAPSSTVTQPQAPNADPTSVTLAGDLQSQLGVGCGNWQPGCAGSHLIDRGNGIWSRTFAVPVGNWQYKMVLNNDWGNGAYSGNVTVGGDNNTALNITGTSPVSVTF